MFLYTHKWRLQHFFYEPKLLQKCFLKVFLLLPFLKTKTNKYIFSVTNKSHAEDELRKVKNPARIHS